MESGIYDFVPVLRNICMSRLAVVELHRYTNGTCVQACPYTYSSRLTAEQPIWVLACWNDYVSLIVENEVLVMTNVYLVVCPYPRIIWRHRTVELRSGWSGASWPTAQLLDGNIERVPIKDPVGGPEAAPNPAFGGVVTALSPTDVANAVAPVINHAVD